MTGQNYINNDWKRYMILEKQNNTLKT